MAHHDNEALVGHEKVLQPLNGRQVQMVGGLVQQDDVRLAEQCLGQQHLHLLLGGEGGHLTVQDVVGEAQALDQPGDVALGLPASHLRELSLQLGGPDAVLIAEVLFFVEGVLLLHDVVEVLVAHNDRVQYRVLVILEVVLLQDGHPLVGRDDDLAAGGLQVAGEDAEEGGLPRAVGSDDAVAVAGGEFQVHMLEQGLAGEVDADVADCDHSSSFLLGDRFNW